MGGAAQAATLTVGSKADTTGATDCADSANTDCTLRQAILDGNNDPGSTITFRSGLSGRITLGSGLPFIFVPMTISGPGAGQLAIDGNGAGRVFDIYTDTGDDVSISGLTITNGSTSGPGAGIRSKYADLTLSDAVVSGNDAEQNGGGVDAYDGGSLTIENSTISGNSSGGRGGGVATNAFGGTEATIRNSTISGNSGVDFGGGVYLDFMSPALVENSTIYGNRITASGSASASGGGIYAYGAPVGNPGQTILGSTITHNSAPRGGGIGAGGAADYATTRVRNSIVSGNSAPDGPDLSTYTDGGSLEVAFSLIGGVDPDATLNQTGPNLFGQDPQLGPLADNGGATKTQKPAATSPAIDQGAAFGLGSDQRGLGRPFEIPSIPNAAGGDGSDIGAVELQASELPSSAFTAKLKGKKLIVSVVSAGTVKLADVKAPLAVTAKKKKKRKLLLKAVSGSGAPPTISVPLRLTKLAKQKLRRKGKLAVKARITFTPNRGLASTKSLKLKIKQKK
jgi:hypothetical protein